MTRQIQFTTGAELDVAYVPLRVHSNYSLLRGAAPIRRYLDKAAAWNLPALALTDRNNLYGVLPFCRQAAELGVKAILGCHLHHPVQGEAILLVEDAAGYANLCCIISARRLSPSFSLINSIAEHQTGLVVMTPDPRLAASFAAILDEGRLWLELLRPAACLRTERRLLHLAHRHGLGLVASGRHYLAAPDDLERFTMLHAIRHNCLFDEAGSAAAAFRYDYFRPPQQFAALFADQPQAVQATLSLAERCNFELFDRPPIFPKLSGDSRQRLSEQSLAGARERYGSLNPELRQRLNYEQDLIRRKGFTDYFLVVADIVRHARRLGTPIAGRGSGASSLVAYCLGITNVDPMHFKLPFERFLNEGRKDFPDLDIDICWRLRDGVIDYVYQRYGKDHVAMISTHISLQPRLAFRCCAKALGLSPEVITECLQMMPQLPPATADDAPLPRSWESLPADPATVRDARRLAQAVEGFPHHLSIHPGGVVITPQSLSTYAPLERAAKGIVVTQYEKDTAAAVGLIKIDLLGNRALSTMAEATRLIAQRHKIYLHPEQLPRQDAQTSQLLAQADSIGINQLESPAMRHLLAQVQPQNARQVMQALALIRPGAAGLGMKQAFVRRARGVEAVPPIDPRLDEILQDTYGIMLYEDEALFIAGALAGLPPAQADRFRKAITKCRSDWERQQLSQRFLKRCHANGVDPDIAADLWVQMAKFNSYSFCRAHAASYGQLAWANAYIKARYAAEFWVAALNNNDGMYDRWVYLEEAKRCGIQILPPCVQYSVDDFVLEGDAIRIGLACIRGLSRNTRQSIRENRPFDNLFDFLVRTTVTRREAESLILCGATSAFSESTEQQCFSLALSYSAARQARKQGCLLPSYPAFATHTRIPPRRTTAEVQRDQWRLLGMSAGPHPIRCLRPWLDKYGFQVSSSLNAQADKQVTLAGIPAAGRVIRTDKDETLCFLSLSDEAGIFDLTIPPAAYAANKLQLAVDGSGLLWIQGTVRRKHGSLTVETRALGRLQDRLDAENEKDHPPAWPRAAGDQ